MPTLRKVILRSDHAKEEEKQVVQKTRMVYKERSKTQECSSLSPKLQWKKQDNIAKCTTLRRSVCGVQKQDWSRKWQSSSRLQLHKEANIMTNWWEPQQKSKQNKFEAKKTALFTVSNYAKKHIAQHHLKQFHEKVCEQQNIITFKRKARMLSPISNTAKKTPTLQRKKQLDTANGASLTSFMSGGTKQTQEITKAQRALAMQAEW